MLREVDEGTHINEQYSTPSDTLEYIRQILENPAASPQEEEQKIEAIRNYIGGTGV